MIRQLEASPTTLQLTDPSDPTRIGPDALRAYFHEELVANRAELVGRLTQVGEISKSFAESGILDRFDIDESMQTEAVGHILVGDQGGGAHHLRSIMKAEVPGRAISATIDPNNEEQHKRHVRDQRVRHNGLFRARSVKITDEVLGIEKDKKADFGSGFFPDEWSAEDVLGAIVEVADTEPRELNDRGNYLHDATIDGVRIKVFTSAKTGKIITGFPHLRF